MSGHSKWHNIQKTKGAADAKRAQAFTKIAREMIVAVKEGGSGDPRSNSRLAAVIAKAKAANMPNDNIKRTIDKALGSGNNENYEKIVYEGYGPSGVAVIVETMTDNRNRTAGEMRHYFDKYGGNMGPSNCVSWSFDKKGVIIIDNKTNPQALLGIQKISMVLAAEMYIKATEQVEGSLYRRTIYGISREIRWHYYAYLACKLNVVRYADIGGMNEDRNDYDYNAKMFENPLRTKEVVQEWIFSNIINKMAVVSFLDPVIYNMQN